MNQCVPSWDLEEAKYPTPVPVVPMSDFEVAELTWENGNISSHGHGATRIIKAMAKYPTAATSPATPISTWAKQQLTGGGTLEEVVKEAARTHMLLPIMPGGGHTPRTVDALVPCTRDDQVETCMVVRKRARVVGEDGKVCASQGSWAPADQDLGFTTTTNNSTSLTPLDGGSPDTENASIGGGANDSFCHSRPSQRDVVCDEEDHTTTRKSDIIERASISTKRSRAAAIHNESERKRRDRINQKMKTLQKLVPNSSKTDKASMLDKVIDYLKQLQAQVNMMSRMGSMMMPMTAMPPLQMSMMAQMTQMAQMAQFGMMNLGQLGHPAGYPGLTATAPLPYPIPAAFSPFAPISSTSWDTSGDRTKQFGGNAMPDPFGAFLASQAGQQQTSVEAYGRIAAMYQQMYQQNQQPNPDP